VPDYHPPYLPGEELFTLVLPGNKVVVLQTDWFTERSEEKIKIKIKIKITSKQSAYREVLLQH